MKPRMRWRKQTNDQGLAVIGQAPRGYDLMVGDEDVASVRPVRIGWQEWRGWSWLALGDGVGRKLGGKHETPEAAKAEAEAYVRRCLGRRGVR